MFERPYLQMISQRIREPRKFMQVITGPPQVGKTTPITPLTRTLKSPFHIVSADAFAAGDRHWLRQQWDLVRIRLLLQQGLTESLAGRFETTYMGHWKFTEMLSAFD